VTEFTQLHSGQQRAKRCHCFTEWPKWNCTIKICCRTLARTLSNLNRF